MYEIIIKKTESKLITGEKEYRKIADTGGDDGGAKYDYVIIPEHTKEVQVEVFKQQRDEINIIDVVAAFNGVTFNK